MLPCFSKLSTTLAPVSFEVGSNHAWHARQPAISYKQADDFPFGIRKLLYCHLLAMAGISWVD